jgi:hypothetical protein
MIVEVKVNEEKLLRFFDILNALKDDMVIEFNAHYKEEVEDVEYEDETDTNNNQSS